VGGHVISLTDYRQLQLAANREIATGPSVRMRSKKASHPQSMKTQQQQLVGSHVDSVDRVAVDLIFCRANVSSKWWDYKFILQAIFFLGCLAVVAFGL
jgi:hypothetical protein